MTATYADPAVPSLRRVASLAFPALVVLAAEPLYVLVDTAVVGHLGRTPLASLAIGAPGLMLGTAGNGWLRGVQDTRRPLVYVLGANALSAALCPLLVYPLGLGLVGSAIANAAAQSLAGVLFIWALVAERVPLRPLPTVIRRQLGVGRDLLLRGAAFQACFLSAAAVAARFGAAALAAHQIALQLWMFCALALDAVAIAAQSLIGAELGAGRAGQARWLARRISLIGL